MSGLMNGPLGPDGLHTRSCGPASSISIQYNQSYEQDPFTLVSNGPGSRSHSVAITYLSSLQIQGLAISKHPSIQTLKNLSSGSNQEAFD